MATGVAVVTGLVGDAASETKDFVKSGFGTPDLAIFFYSAANTGNNPSTSLGGMGIGAYDGTNQRGAGITIDGGAATSVTRSRSVSGDVVTVPNLASGRYVEASASFITDGARLTVTHDSTSVERYVTAILLKGLDNAKVGAFQSGGGTSAQSVTGVGFKATDVICFGLGKTSSSTSAPGRISWGHAHRNASDVITQKCISFASDNGETTMKTMSAIRDDKILSQLENDSVDYNLEISNFGSDGFDLTYSSTELNDIVYYIAIDTPGDDDITNLIVDTATSTGNDSFTGSNHQPEVVITSQSFCTAVNTVTQTGFIAAGASDGTTERTLDCVDEDAAATSNVESEMTSKAINIKDDDGTLEVVGTVNSLDSDGATFNYTTVDASARKMLVITIGDSSASETTAAPEDANHTQTAEKSAASQNHNVSTKETAHAQTVEQCAVTQNHEVKCKSSSHAQPVENCAVSQNHAVGCKDASHSQAVEDCAVTQAVGVTCEDSTHSQTSENCAVSQNHNVTCEDATHAQSVEDCAVTQNHNVTVKDSTHGQTAENCAVTEGSTVACEDSTHAQTAEPCPITQVHLVGVKGCTHAQTAENCAVTEGSTVPVEDSTHSQTADKSAVTQIHLVSCQDAASVQASERCAVTQLHLVKVEDAFHGQTAENPTATESTDYSPSERRMLTVGAERRNLKVFGENRNLTVSAEGRTVKKEVAA